MQTFITFNPLKICFRDQFKNKAEKNGTAGTSDEQSGSAHSANKRSIGPINEDVYELRKALK